jgi:hypothetical protein
MNLLKSAKSKAVLAFLKQDEILNLNMIGMLKYEPKAEIYVDDLDQPTGVFIRTTGYFNYLYTKNNAFIDAVCDTFTEEGFYGFSGVEDSISEHILSKFKEDWRNKCTLYYLPSDKLDLSLQKTKAVPLDPKWAPLVDQHYPYSGSHSLNAIIDNLKNRLSSAIFIDEEPVCWVMIHEDDSIGIMHTQEDHRRKGYAVDVTIDLCRRLIEAGEIPYLQIVDGNEQSPGLALKCGFEAYGKCSWFGFTVGNPVDEDNE